MMVEYYISVYNRMSEGEAVCIACHRCRVRNKCHLGNVLCLKWIQYELDISDVDLVPHHPWVDEFIERIVLRLIGFGIAEMEASK